MRDWIAERIAPIPRPRVYTYEWPSFPFPTGAYHDARLQSQVYKYKWPSFPFPTGASHDVRLQSQVTSSLAAREQLNVRVSSDACPGVFELLNRAYSVSPEVFSCPYVLPRHE